MVGDDLRVVAANRQVCPTISEISFGNLYKHHVQTQAPKSESETWSTRAG